VGNGFVVANPITDHIRSTGMPAPPVAFHDETPQTDIRIDGGVNQLITHRHLTGIWRQTRMVEDRIEQTLEFTSRRLIGVGQPIVRRLDGDWRRLVHQRWPRRRGRVDRRCSSLLPASSRPKLPAEPCPGWQRESSRFRLHPLPRTTLPNSPHLVETVTADHPCEWRPSIAVGTNHDHGSSRTESGELVEVRRGPPGCNRALPCEQCSSELSIPLGRGRCQGIYPRCQPDPGTVVNPRQDHARTEPGLFSLLT
jgi:hypothetical protein